MSGDYHDDYDGDDDEINDDDDDDDDLFFRLDFKQPGEKILANVRQIVKNSEVNTLPSDDDVDDDYDNCDDYNNNENEKRQKK